MTYDRRRVRELTTASEFALVQQSSSGTLRGLSEKALQRHIARARRLRDKQRDLLRRQRLARRAHSGSKHGAAERTSEKAEIFDEALSRFTSKLHTMKSKARSTKAPKKPPKRGQAALLQKARTPRMKSVQAHVSSRGRRSQARRDSR